MRVLMLGAPGSGKGTHGVRIAERYGVPHLSTGDLLREQVANRTEIGQLAAPIMKRGDLLPDDLIIAMVLDKLTGPGAPDGYVLDGFPRTLTQAHAAYDAAVRSGLTLDAVVCLDLDHDELARRLEERGRALGRADDEAAVIRHRIEVYEQQTLPLLGYYEDRGILLRIDADGTIDEVRERIFAALDAVSVS